MKTERLRAIFDKDSRKFHRFNIEENEYGVVGTIYVPRGEDVLDVVEIQLCTKAERAEKEGCHNLESAWSGD